MKEEIVAFDIDKQCEVSVIGTNSETNTYTIKVKGNYADVDCDQLLWAEKKKPDKMVPVPIDQYDIDYGKTVYFLHNGHYYRVYFRRFGVSYNHYRKTDDTKAKYHMFLAFVQWLRREQMGNLYKLVPEEIRVNNNQIRLL